MIKIRSITDVITNSSNEIYLVVKIEDLEEAKKIKEVYDNCFSGGVNILDEFEEFKTMDDIEEKFRNNPIRSGMMHGDLTTPRNLLRKTYLSPRERQILQEFGHSDREIDGWISRKEDERKELRDKNETLRSVLGKAALCSSDHALDYFKDWLEKNGKEFDDIS